MLSDWSVMMSDVAVGDDVALLALEAVEHLVGQIVGVEVLDAHQPGDVARRRACAGRAPTIGQRREARLGVLDDAQELARRLDGQADRIEGREEQPVGLLGRDQLGRDDGDLLACWRTPKRGTACR